MQRTNTLVAGAVLLMTLHTGAQQPRAGGGQGAAMKAASKGLTDVPGIAVGHVTMTERPTGCTVILTEAGAVAGVDVRGSAPGTMETDLLNPINMVEQAHAIVLSGGSASGLDTASGVMRYLEEKNIGVDTRFAKVPIVR